MSAPRKTERDAFADVGRAMRQSVGRAASADLSNGARRTHAAVFALVSSYSRLTDRVYVYEIAHAACLSERQTRTCLDQLAELGIIVWRPGRGRSVQSVLGLPPAPETGSSGLPVSHSSMNGGADEKPEGTAHENRRDCSEKPEALDCRDPSSPEETYREESREVDAYASTSLVEFLREAYGL